MRIHVDVRIDPSRHDGESLQIIGRALRTGVNPGDARSLNNNTHIARHPAFTIDECRGPDDNRALLSPADSGQHQTGGRSHPQ